MQLQNPKIYHIIHIDKLQSIINHGFLWSDAEVIRRGLGGTTIGMSSIKQRRLDELTLQSHPDLHVGQCVPFYFCPRSVMLYMMYRGNSLDITYQGGQENIIHLEANLHTVVEWANKNGKRWAFTSSNAGSRYFEDTNDLNNLAKLNWQAINSIYWNGVIEEKQAEFLCEYSFSWDLIERIGVNTLSAYQQVQRILNSSIHKPVVEIKDDWYY